MILIYNKNKKSYKYDKNKIELTLNNNRFIFIGNIILFNTNELKKQLKLKNYKTSEEIAIIGYYTDGPSFFNKINGEFSFIIINKTLNEIFFVRDITSNKRLYYYNDYNSLIISSRLSSIVSDINFNKRINKNRLYYDTAFIKYNNNETYFKNTFLLLKREYGLYKNKVININKYYQMPTKRFYYKNKIDYLHNFEDILKQAIKNRIKPSDNVGIMLSGGIDSSTIAHNISKIFFNKTINSYTHIPYYLTDAQYNHNKYILNEKELVNIFLENHNNFNHEFIDSKDSSIINIIYKSLEEHPEPIKNVNNLFWYYDIIYKAKQQGINKLINAQKGNLNISWPTDFFYKTYYRNNYKTKTKKALIKLNIYDFFTTQKRKNNLIKTINSNEILSSNTKNNIIKNIKHTTFFNNIYKNYRKDLLFNEFPTPFYTMNKPTIIDLTMDKELIEFLFNIPVDFYKTTPNNKFIKLYLQNKISDKIIFNKKRGIQSSDIDERIKKEQKIINEIIEMCSNNPLVNDFFSINSENKHLITLKELQKIIFLYEF